MNVNLIISFSFKCIKQMKCWIIENVQYWSNIHKEESNLNKINRRVSPWKSIIADWCNRLVIKERIFLQVTTITCSCEFTRGFVSLNGRAIHLVRFGRWWWGRAGFFRLLFDLIHLMLRWRLLHQQNASYETNLESNYEDSSDYKLKKVICYGFMLQIS